MKTLLAFLILIIFASADVPDDKMDKIPGYGEFNTSIYSGYLSTGN